MNPAPPIINYVHFKEGDWVSVIVDIKDMNYLSLLIGGLGEDRW